jgi:spore coat polysaccharide biosynthesis protein SpsF
MINGKRVVAVIQARMSSSRLPGKVVMPLSGQPLIMFMIARVKRAKLVDHIVVATSTDASDDDLTAILAQHDIDCWRGSLDDVLSRFYDAAVCANADIVVRLTGDCPLIDADLIDTCVALLADQGLDYVTNTTPPSYPDGLDVEAMTMAALKSAVDEAQLKSEREHVTPFIRTHAQRFAAGAISSAVDLSALRWTIDYDDDLAAVRAMVEAIAGDPITADRFEYLRVIDRLKLTDAGATHTRNEGLQKSLQND